MANLPPRSSNTHLVHGLSTATLSSDLPTSAPTSINCTRVTRSSARLAAESPVPTNSTDSPSRGSTIQPTKKRKVESRRSSSPAEGYREISLETPPHRTKRQKTDSATHDISPASTPATRASRRKSTSTDAAMSSHGSSSKFSEESLKQIPTKSASKRSSSKGEKKVERDASPPVQTPSIRKQRKRPPRKDIDTKMKQDETVPPKISKRGKDTSSPPPPPHPQSDSNGGDSPNEADDDDDQDPFSQALFGSSRGGPTGLSSTLRALSGMMSGMSSRLRDILTNLRQVDNPSMQMVALEELSNLLLVSNEDNLSGQFSPDPYVKELVALMQPNPITGEENPEMMLLSCRCLANLMEALRGSVANVVYGGAVPVLCQKLLDIQYIDVAEQALSTLSKVSVDFPSSIVREGGLTACLQFLDFFATGTQRTAVTTAANCCRNIPHDSFPVIRDVMPILQNVLASHDQKVVEQGCLCVTRVIDSFKHSPDKLEQLVDPALLRAILGLLVPGTTNLIGAGIHTEFLRVLAIVARASPKLSTELLKLGVVDTLYQILTGISPPSETANAASKIDSVVIMQALIHRPREQVYETLNVICELLPRPKVLNDLDYEIYDGLNDSGSDNSDASTPSRSKTNERLQLLQQCKQETRRFAIILLPTLTDAFSSTVNLSVRQKVLTAQLKILSNLETSVIEEALRPIPYASFLASILSQEDHPSLVMFALQASEMLFERLEDIYQYQFHREGVISEIQKLAARPQALLEKSSSSGSVETANEVSGQSHEVEPNEMAEESEHDEQMNEKADEASSEDDLDDNSDDEEDNDDEVDDDENDEEHNQDEIIVGDDNELEDSQSSDSSDEDVSQPVAIAGINDLIIMRASKFLEKYDTTRGRDMKGKAGMIRKDLQNLASTIQACYADKSSNKNGLAEFERLAKYFNGDPLERITSSELLESGIIRVLLEVLLNGPPLNAMQDPRLDFLLAFMGVSKDSIAESGTASSASTALSRLIQKLQDLFSRAEHFEVLTVNSNASESSRSSSTSMLSRQLRLRLVAEPDGDIPNSYREMIVSIHAIATFKALDDYLRPRFSLSEQLPTASRRREMLQQLANARMAQLSGAAESGLFSPFGHELGSRPSSGDSEQRSSSRLSARNKVNSKAESKPNESNEQKRTTRRNPAITSGECPPAPEPSTEQLTDQLECPDEKVLKDDSQNNNDGNAALETFVDGLDDDVSDEDMHEPEAVNMEVASSGKVTARQDDGTRVFTPQHPGTPASNAARPPSAAPSPSLKSTAAGGQQNKPSYAAALVSVPQDWHIEFSIDGNVIPNNTTIYRAVHHNREQPSEPSPRSVWSGIHTVRFRRAKGPPAHQSSFESPADATEAMHDTSSPPALSDHSVTSSILALLRILHDLNGNLDDYRENLGSEPHGFYEEPLASFINTKLTAKMNRQLEEPLIVASNCLPDWSEYLTRTFPFLFPFETRHLFLQSTSFGYSRSMTRWQSDTDDRRDRRRDDRPLLGRPQRQKVRISRSRILESAMKVMEIYGASPSVLEVEYFEEVGTGLGPTLEFYSTVSREFSKKKLKMWRENDSNEKDEFAFGNNGLFPAPMGRDEVQTESGKKLLQFFKVLGKFVARSMLDSRIIDISFNPTFFKLAANHTIQSSISLLRTIDRDLANSIAQLQRYVVERDNIESNQKLSSLHKAKAIADLNIHGARIEDLMLDFTLPGYPSIELIDGGADTAVNTANVDLYIEQVLDFSLGNGVRHQIEAFKSGFSQVFSYASLRAFTPNELVMLFGRSEEDWSIETLMDSVKADHGFNLDSKSVKNLLQTMSEFSSAQRRDFLQFVTGSPKLPIGGFKSLTPMFTVVCKPSEAPYTSDDYLPSVMTCVNYLKLPDYSSQEVLKGRLNVAIREGQGAFHLS